MTMERMRPYTDSTDEAGESTADDAELVMSESENGTGRKRKYTVKRGSGGSRFAICEPSTLSRNERLCIIVGAVILVVVVLVFIIVGIAVNVGSSSSSSESEEPAEPWMSIRLPRDVIPESYEIMLEVDMENFAVDGSEMIRASVAAETSYVILHFDAMTISEANVLADGQTLEKEREFPYSDNQFYVIKLSSALKVGGVTISLKFNYTLGETLVGFYRSSYVDSSEQTHNLAVTQFEPTDARRAFPCFDEPDMKANFTIHITHGEQFHATSNMPAVDSPEPVGNGMVTTKFKPSVKMSTYLVAFVVSEFSCVKSKTGRNGIEVWELELIVN